MKIERKELYSIENLTREELLFLLEVIEKISLSPESTQISHEIANKFKQFRNQLVSSPSELTGIECEGCGSMVAVNIIQCPIEGKELPLCSNCEFKRKQLAKNI